MTQKINKNTGYPMSTTKQIEKAKENLQLAQQPHVSNYERGNQIAKEIGSELRSKEEKYQQYMSMKLEQLISSTPEKADLAYKIGDWGLAEKEYLKIFFLDTHFAEKLRVIYQKEKRFHDAEANP